MSSRNPGPRPVWNEAPMPSRWRCFRGNAGRLRRLHRLCSILRILGIKNGSKSFLTSKKTPKQSHVFCRRRTDVGVETGQMSAAETAQMSSAETRQMSTGRTGRCPFLPIYICLVSAEDICPVSVADICPVSTADICPVSTEDIYPVSTEDLTAAGRRPAAVLSSVEIG